MVEGHQCHRVAAAHRKLLLGRAFIARSPNGRFKEGAAAINAKPLQRIEVHGKNLFYFFAPPPSTLPSPATATAAAIKDPPPSTSTSTTGGGGGISGGSVGNIVSGADPCDGTVVVHVHFGMSGAFRTMSLPGPAPTDTTRLELINREMGLVAHLSAMTVTHGSLALYTAKATQLGPDPLREDADKELLWSRVVRSRKPIGLVLMDQSLVAGLGNIYRAEVLFKAGVHPELPAGELSRSQYDRIWYHSVDLLQRGFVTGSIITVDPQEATRLGSPWTRRYIYNQRMCGRCRSPVRSWDMAGRTVYCCETCQPLRRDATDDHHPADTQQDQPVLQSHARSQYQQQDQQQGGKAGAGAGGGAGGGVSGSGVSTSLLLAPARLAAMAAARVPRLFPSRCAPDEDEDAQAAPAKLTVAKLRTHLRSLNLDTRGTKPQLVARLEAAMRWTTTPTTATTTATAVAPQVAVQAAGAAKESGARPQVQLRRRSIRGMRGRDEAAEEAELVKAEMEVREVADASADAQLRPRCGGGGGSSDSEVTLDRAGRVLTESMAAGSPAAASPLDELSRLAVVQLRIRLRELGLSTTGTKPTLTQRLTTALTAAAAAPAAAAAAAPPALPVPPPDPPSTPRALPVAAATAAGAASTTIAPPRSRKVARSLAFASTRQLPDAAAAAEAEATPSTVLLRGGEDGDGGTPTSGAAGGGGGGGGGSRGMYDIQPGIRGLEARMVSARDAAVEKLLAGENRAVEHVALEDDEVVDLLAEQPTPRARKRARSLAAAMEAAAAREDEEDQAAGEEPAE